MSKKSRNEMRAAFFGGLQFKSKKIRIFDTWIEVRQPSIGELSAMNNLEGAAADRNALIELMIQYSYVPGTTDKVFEDSDREHMLDFPMGDWAQTFQETWMELAGVNSEESVKNSETISTDKTS